MSTIRILKAYKAFLKDVVATTIKLKKPDDDNTETYELVNPQVHIGWIPPKGYLPPEMESAMPCLIVQMDEADTNAQSADIKIRISFAVWSPGTYLPEENGGVDYTPDFDGYIDLINLIDRTVDELVRNRVIGDVTTVQLPIKYGMYAEQPYPYWYGWITFTTSGQPKLFTKDIQKLL